VTAERSVLVLTHHFDPTADCVVEDLNRRDVQVFRCDTSEFPTTLSVGAELTNGQWSGHVRTSRRTLDLTNVAGIYYRRPTSFEFHPDLSTEERRWAEVQARLGFGGLLATLEPWLNHPHQIGYVEYKPVQLQAAARCGLRTPRTYVGNDPDAARAFMADVGKVIYKPFGGSGIIDDEGVQQVFASVVTLGQIGSENVVQTMHLFQQWVSKDYDVRLTVVDDQFFAVRIDASTETGHIDWRTDYRALTYTPIETPKFVRSRVTTLMHRLGLRFVALDFVVAPDGEWWFLECNPNGQWAWIEDATGMPISVALADALEGRSLRD
jgi:ATP-grasp ribosomal peptide maturase